MQSSAFQAALQQLLPASVKAVLESSSAAAAAKSSTRNAGKQPATERLEVAAAAAATTTDAKPSATKRSQLDDDLLPMIGDALDFSDAGSEDEALGRVTSGVGTAGRNSLCLTCSATEKHLLSQVASSSTSAPMQHGGGTSGKLASLQLANTDLGDAMRSPPPRTVPRRGTKRTANPATGSTVANNSSSVGGSVAAKRRHSVAHHVDRAKGGVLSISEDESATAVTGPVVQVHHMHNDAENPLMPCVSCTALLETSLKHCSADKLMRKLRKMKTK